MPLTKFLMLSSGAQKIENEGYSSGIEDRSYDGHNPKDARRLFELGTTRTKIIANGIARNLS